MDSLGQIFLALPAAGVLTIALLLDALLPDVRLLPRAAKIAGRAARAFAKRLDRPDRPRQTRQVRGLLVALLIAGFAGGGAWVLSDLATHIPAIGIVEVLLLVWLLGLRSVWTRTRRAAHDIEANTGAEPYRESREAIAAAAAGFLDKAAGPAFWFLVAGLPGAAIYTSVSGLAAEWPKPRGGFPLSFHRLHVFLGWVPAWIAAVLIALAALFTPKGRPRAAFTNLAAHLKAPVSNGPVAALAGGLGLALGGPVPGAPDAPWLGDGRARVTGADIARAEYVYVVACVLMLTSTAALTHTALQI